MMQINFDAPKPAFRNPIFTPMAFGLFTLSG
jgi:hypothetical protein